MMRGKGLSVIGSSCSSFIFSFVCLLLDSSSHPFWRKGKEKRERVHESPTATFLLFHFFCFCFDPTFFCRSFRILDNKLFTKKRKAHCVPHKWKRKEKTGKESMAFVFFLSLLLFCEQGWQPFCFCRGRDRERERETGSEREESV
mmetsp:Transcript_28443/g.55700  ORF Transcript_28443/g.55700 Transcript_28443/m.55700 type:complete len:145 (+) Transcript_28443:1745-2179(+)